LHNFSIQLLSEGDIPYVSNFFLAKQQERPPTYSFLINLKRIFTYTRPQASREKGTGKKLETTQPIREKNLGRRFCPMQDPAKLFTKSHFPTTKRSGRPIKDDGISMTPDCSASNHDNFPKNP
jgi:hypothetical protein